ncbi:rolling circle replication-associated protein [Escherichia sp. E4385]|uniref:rolling circle replication-associated protein n=1 Tax=Escherichia sp. E4385 TaxID=2040639 RepID=UPI00403F2DD3
MIFRFVFFGCGEYGSKLERPHYHAIIFGYDFPDKTLHKAGRFNLYRSSLLERCWTFGWSVVAAFSFESAAYVARYCVKKSHRFPCR